jgi:hypothetical protein
VSSTAFLLLLRELPISEQTFSVSGDENIAGADITVQNLGFFVGVAVC